MNQHKKVLVVDDESETTYRVKRFIERRYPIDVTVSTDVRCALDLLAHNDFDAVLTDIHMGPGENGLDLASEVIRLYPKTIVVIISGSGDLEQLARLKGVRFMMKPVHMNDFTHMIYDVFGFM